MLRATKYGDIEKDFWDKAINKESWFLSRKPPSPIIGSEALGSFSF